MNKPAKTFEASVEQVNVSISLVSLIRARQPGWTNKEIYDYLVLDNDFDETEGLAVVTMLQLDKPIKI